jgi:lipopolysaccharide/colanic/teichoic acid biosynthesis glycosyltransferase
VTDAAITDPAMARPGVSDASLTGTTVTELFEVTAPVTAAHRPAGEPTVPVDPEPADTAAETGAARTVGALVKRLFDVAAASVLLLLCLPLFAAVSCAILVDSGGPVTFRARRLGRGGRVFTMYKFRTMVPNAAALLAEYTHLNLGVGMVKIPDDPRVTRAGRWLRAFSLDELPQLWNVIRGDMSLVGPRPHDVGELSLADDAVRLRLSVRPGLTGLWQIAARDDPLLSTRVHHDISYVQNWSLWADAKIVLKTVPVVLRGSGGRIAQREPAAAGDSSSS